VTIDPVELDGNPLVRSAIGLDVNQPPTMGPKRPAIASAPASNSRELAVARTRRKSSDEEDLSRALVPHSGQRIINPLTTSKALILRAKETGGELILARNITGPEKLRLKAGWYILIIRKEPILILTSRGTGRRPQGTL